MTAISTTNPVAPSGIAPPRSQLAVLLVAGLALAVCLLLALRAGGFRHALLVPIGALAGLALYHAKFGFTGAWRTMFTNRRGVGIRAQIVMIALAALAMFPILAQGEAFGRPVFGFVFPVGVALVVGGFLFGIGMQLGGGCGSGTLFTVGGGSLRMLVTLAFFIAGSVLATATSEFWLAWPAFAPVSAVESYGAIGALGLVGALLAGLYAIAAHIERQRHGTIAPLLPSAQRWSWRFGPWPLIVAAVALALVNALTLITAGQPWGITSAFALWGAKLLAAAGMDIGAWSYWRGQEEALAASVFADVTSVMDFALIAGAMAGAGLAGAFRPDPRIAARSLAAAMIGGLMMGIGARLGTGCNIGALFSGAASGSLHAAVWLVVAVAGNWVGVRIRPWFRLD